MHIRIATRKSPLALWQAQHVKALLQARMNVSVSLVEIVTKGDRFLDKPLMEIGGKGLFIKALEEALLSDRADIAVHSMKDLPTECTEGLQIACVLERGDPRDRLVSIANHTWQQLPKGAVIGTSSLRRSVQLKALRPDVNIKVLRGNVGTRLKKLQDGLYDAIVLATSGLDRLGYPPDKGVVLHDNVMLPAAGQGAIAVECLSAREDVLAWLRPLNHAVTHRCIEAERAFNHAVGGGCHQPIAAYATLEADHRLYLRIMVACQQTEQKMIRYGVYGRLSEASALGHWAGRVFKRACGLHWSI